METILIYVALGVFTGTLAGLFGVGGGAIIVPVLCMVFESQGVSDSILVHLAIGTSLATIVVTSIASMRAHHKRGAVRWDLFRSLAPGIVVGALLGAMVADLLSGRALRVVFGIFALGMAVQIGLNLMVSPQRLLPGRVGLGVAGMVVGTVSSLVGIGGGALTVPFLVWCNVAIRQAIATSSACGLPIAIAGALGYVVAGWNVPALPSASTGYVYWPAFAGIAATSLVFAPWGARLAHTLPIDTLRRIFGIFLAALGLKMLIG